MNKGLIVIVKVRIILVSVMMKRVRYRKIMLLDVVMIVVKSKFSCVILVFCNKFRISWFVLLLKLFRMVYGVE